MNTQRSLQHVIKKPTGKGYLLIPATDSSGKEKVMVKQPVLPCGWGRRADETGTEGCKGGNAK